MVSPSNTHSIESCGAVLRFAVHMVAGILNMPFHAWTYPWKRPPSRDAYFSSLKKSAGRAFSPERPCSK